jgi:hypothetical protein
MSHPTTKKQRLEDNDDQATNDKAVLATVDNLLASFGALSVDMLANIFGYLTIEEIMSKRRINKKTREAAKMTTVPFGDFRVDSLEKYNAMVVMTRELPNLQQIMIGYIGWGSNHKWSDGEDPNEELTASTAYYIPHDIGIISNFSKLRVLDIYDALNGRYPYLFNNFPLLQKLSIRYCHYLKFDLEMLAGMPSLKELYCDYNEFLTGNMNNLRVIKDTLEKVTMTSCWSVEGNFMDVADFPRLKELNLRWTAVTGDIRDISENNFSSLEHLILPKGVYCGMGYEFQRISDGADLMRTLYQLNAKRPVLSILERWYVKLSEDSPAWYGPVEDEEEDETPPFFIHFVKVGSRIGYRWETDHRKPCEVNWLDPEPEEEVASM